MVSNPVSSICVVLGQSHTNYIQDFEIQIFESLRNYQNREMKSWLLYKMQ